MRKIFLGKYETTLQMILIFLWVVFFASVVSAQEVIIQRTDGAPNQRRPGERFFGGERRPPNGESPRQPFPRRNRPNEAAVGVNTPNAGANERSIQQVREFDSQGTPISSSVVVNTPNAGAVNVERNERSIQRLNEFDTNKNGILEQNEIADPQRRETVNRIVTRLGGNPNQIPINISELAKKAAANSGAISPPDGLPGDPLVPYFGEKEPEREAIIGFGERSPTRQNKTTANETAKPKADKLAEIKATMTRFDANHNGTLDKDKGEWNGVPFDANKADQNKDGRISMDELVTVMGGGVNAGGSPALVRVKPSVPYERLPEGVPPWFFDRDLDQDAQLTMLEYANGAELNERIASEFMFLDRNNDGFATIAEIFLTLKQVDEEKQKQDDEARRERELKLGNANNRINSTITPGEIPISNSTGTIRAVTPPIPADGSPPPPPPFGDGSMPPPPPPPSVHDSDGKPIQVERIADPSAPFGFTDRIAAPNAPDGFIQLPHVAPGKTIHYASGVGDIVIKSELPPMPTPSTPSPYQTPIPDPPPSSNSPTDSWSPGSPTSTSSANGSSGNNGRTGTWNSRTWSRERNGDRPQTERRGNSTRRSR